MQRTTATIVREYTFPDVTDVHGVSFDGANVWIATGEALNAIDPDSGKSCASSISPRRRAPPSTASTCFRFPATAFRKSIRRSGKVIASIPTPDGGAAGMAWAEGSLWVGQHRNRKIHQVDPETGKVLRTIESNRFVTGVTWVGDELWHGTWEGEHSELRHIDPKTGEVLEQLDMPAGIIVSGLESNGRDTFYCGGGNSGKVRAVRKPA